jgi:hypothetical protein
MRRLLLAALLCLIGWDAQAAISRDAATDFGSGTWWVTNGAGGVASHSVTIGSGSSILLVAVAMIDVAASGGTPPTITTVELDHSGTPITCSGPYKSVTDNEEFPDGQTTALYYCLSPPSGSHTVDVTYAGSSVYILGGSVSYIGVNTTTPFDTGATGNHVNCALGTSCSLGTTVNGSNEWFFSILFCRSGNVSSASSNVVSLITTNTASWMVADSNATVTAGTQTASWTASSASNFPGQIVVALNPAGAAPAASPIIFGVPF